MIIPVILCGGSGTRLWPLSRSHMPKQLHALVGDRTMLQTTISRLNGFSAAPISAPIVVCNDAHRFLTRQQLAEVAADDATLIAEPTGRNSAPALTVAALQAINDAQADVEPTLLVMASDHVIANVAAFHEAVAIAAAAAGDAGGTQDTIVTFGIVPTEPSTGFGYLRMGPTSSAHPDAFDLNAFIEKPNRERARAYLSEGNYLWNSGMFVVRARVWLKAVEALAPSMLASCELALKKARHGGPAKRDVLLDTDAFATCLSDSIDYAVMEKLASHPALQVQGAIVPLDAGWSDVGAWDSAWDVSGKDDFGNVAIGDVIFDNTRDTYVRATGSNPPVIACIGLENTVIVHTPDAILVANKSHAQDVKNIVAVLSSRKDSRVNLHRKVFRPWGWYDSLGAGPEGAGFQVKHIGVYPGQSLSLQLHHKRAEHWVVVKGTATITVGESSRDYHPNEHVFIPVGDVHRLQNKTADSVEIIEVQLGSYLGEDDIVRLEDVYNRT